MAGDLSTVIPDAHSPVFNLMNSAQTALESVAKTYDAASNSGRWNRSNLEALA